MKYRLTFLICFLICFSILAPLAQEPDTKQPDIKKERLQWEIERLTKELEDVKDDLEETTKDLKEIREQNLSQKFDIYLTFVIGIGLALGFIVNFFGRQAITNYINRVLDGQLLTKQVRERIDEELNEDFFSKTVEELKEDYRKILKVALQEEKLGFESEEAIHQSATHAGNDKEMFAASISFYMQRNDLLNAEKEIDNMLARDSNYDLAHYYLGLVRLKQNKPEEACLSWTMAVSLGSEPAREMLDRHCENGNQPSA